MKKRIYFGVVCIIGVLLLSCGNGQLTALKATAKDVAAKLTVEFTKISDKNNELAKELSSLYSTTDLKTVDISKMDEKDGGRFYLFQDKMYVTRFNQETDKDKVAEFYTGAAGKITDDIKREMMVLAKMDDKVVQAKKDNPFLGRISITSDISYQTTYPNADAAAIIPLGIDFMKIPGNYTTVQTANGPFWSVPAISMGVEGIIISRWEPVLINGKFKLAAITAMLLPKAIYSALGDIKDNIFVAHSNAIVFGATASLKKNFSIKSLEVFDYTQQLKANPKMGEEYKLTNDANSADIKALGALITKDNAGKDGLIATINGKKYNVVIEYLPETDIFVVGLI